jgi:glycosyltransferase involved in cell wall biosynthesis
MEKAKIGVGVITYNRPDFFKKCFDSIPQNKIDVMVVVNDGSKLPFNIGDTQIIQHETNKNVGESKNDAMRYLLDQNCDYIFTLEDDIIIKKDNIFQKYIDTSKETGIQHFNFGYSQRENLDNNLKPVWRKIIEYKNSKIVLNQNILGAFTFYTRKALQTIGLHHKDFNKGHGDHLELTYRAYKHGLTTPFWWFADVYGSWDMIENQSNFTTDSKVRNPETIQKYFNEARQIFKQLHGLDIYEVPNLTENEVINCLKTLKNENN